MTKNNTNKQPSLVYIIIIKSSSSFTAKLMHHHHHHHHHHHNGGQTSVISAIAFNSQSVCVWALTTCVNLACMHIYAMLASIPIKLLTVVSLFVVIVVVVFVDYLKAINRHKHVCNAHHVNSFTTFCLFVCLFVCYYI